MGAYIGGQKLEPKILSKIQDIDTHTTYDILGKTTISIPQTITTLYFDSYMYIAFGYYQNVYLADDVYGTNMTSFPAVADVDINKFSYEDLQIFYTLKTDTAHILVTNGSPFIIEKMTATHNGSGYGAFGYKISNSNNDTYILGANFLLKYDGKYVLSGTSSGLQVAIGGNNTYITETGTTSGTLNILEYNIEEQSTKTNVANCPSGTDIQSYLVADSSSSSFDYFINIAFLLSSFPDITLNTITIDGVAIKVMYSSPFNKKIFGSYRVGYENSTKRYIL